MAVVYVPASAENYANSHMTIYASTKGNEKESSTFMSPYRKWRLEDRTVFYSNGAMSRSLNLDKEDYIYATSVLGPSFMLSNGLSYVLVNPHSKSIPYCTYREAGLNVISDSGGFQLLTGKKAFIDPIETIKLYNNICTIGMDLDIPVQLGLGQKVTDALTLIQKKNYETMDQHRDPQVEFCLVNHGVTIEARERFYELMDRPNPKYVSVAGLDRGVTHGLRKELVIAQNILHTLSIYPNIEYLHCLGMTNSTAVTIFALISHLGLAKNIGGDSVSYVMAIASGTFGRYYDFTDVALPKHIPTLVKPSCSCPICRTVGDLRLAGSYLGKAHSMLISKEKVSYIEHMVGQLLAKNVTLKEYISLTNLPLNEQRLHNLIEYVQECKANKFRKLKVKQKGLFKPVDQNPVKPELEAQYKKIIKRYEDYYKTRFL